jgi:hypothetical protein
LGVLGQGGGGVGDPGDGGVVGAVEVVAGQRCPSAGRDATAAGPGEHQRVRGAAVGELAGDGVGDLTGERHHADAGGALGPVFVAAAEPAGLIADLEDLNPVTPIIKGLTSGNAGQFAAGRGRADHRCGARPVELAQDRVGVLGQTKGCSAGSWPSHGVAGEGAAE